jgi:hypothetical protein
LYACKARLADTDAIAVAGRNTWARVQGGEKGEGRNKEGKRKNAIIERKER